MEENTAKKRPLVGDSEGGRKAKRKKKSQEDQKVGLTLELEQAAMMGEIPNLFDMQLAELLKEARMKKKKAEKLTEVVEKLKDVLLNLSPGKKRKLHLRAWMKDVKLPVMEEQPTKGCFQFRAPTHVYLAGSTCLNTCVQPSKAADLILEMPKECFQAKDWLNHRYIRKRAMYLSAMAVRLTKTSLVGDIKFTYHLGNSYKPILVLSVPVTGKPLTIHLHAIPEEGVFKPSRFLITKNNVRPRWFSGQQGEQEERDDDCRSLPPTPVYNTTILQDVCFEANADFVSKCLQGIPEAQDTIGLLKVWLHQRELDVGYGGFSGFLLSMFVCHLLDQGVLLPNMKSYHMLRLVFSQLSESRWLESPVVLCPELGKVKGNRPTLDDFLKAFDVVFVDVTGHVNLALGMTKSLYKRVCHEASLADQVLRKTDDTFDQVFIFPCPFDTKFDSTFTASLTTDVVKKLQLWERALDHGGDVVATVVPRLLEMLEQGLGDRVLLVQPQPVASPLWSVTEDPPPKISGCTFGLLLHSTNSLRPVDRGPAANTPEAVDFRQFWGGKSELRHFKDGQITEAVVWSLSTDFCHRRNACSNIISHVLKRHAGISLSVNCPGQTLPVISGRGEERIYQIHQALEDLGKTLKNLPDLALRINSVIGVDCVSRFSEIFPAHPLSTLKEDRVVPVYTPAMTVILSLEGSGHWPEDIDRLRDLKTLYLIDVAEKLKQRGVRVALQLAYLDVLQRGFVFRLKLGVKREVAVLRMVRTPEGMSKMEDTPEALAVAQEITTLPELTFLVQGIQHPSYCVTVRLIKRWMSAQMILGHVPELVVERIVMHLFTNPQPYIAPGSPLVGLLRFLKLVSSRGYDVSRFTDKTTMVPPPIIMNWWRQVAAQSLKVLQSQPESDWMVIFRPPLDVYDVVIHLSPRFLPRRHQAVGQQDLPAAQNGKKGASQDDSFPVVAFNPAELLLHDLETVYGDWALFFHDRYGGDVIAVLLKPEAKQPKTFEMGNLFGHQPTIIDGEPWLIFDVSAMIENVQTIGQELVRKCTRR